jgi:hypothetical protein
MSTAVDRAFAQLGTMTTSMHLRDRDDKPVVKPKCQYLGPHATAMILAGARLADLGSCITAQSLSRFAGRPAGQIGSDLRHMQSWFERIEPACDGADRCNGKRFHYRLGF